MTTKRCGSCREILPVTDFIARRDKPDKYLPRCKSCRASAQKEKTLQRKPIERKASTLKRTPIKPMSDKRKSVNQQRKEAMLAHFGKRETWKCQGQTVFPHKCFGAINGHEITSRARAGRADANLLDMSGIILLCDWLNGWIEDNPKKAHELGLTKHSWEQ